MTVEMVGIYKITMSIPTDSPNMQNRSREH